MQAAKALQAATGTAPATRFSQDMETDKFVHMQSVVQPTPVCTCACVCVCVCVCVPPIPLSYPSPHVKGGVLTKMGRVLPP